MKYVIISDDNPKDVQEEVEALLNDGWELCGSLCLATTETDQDFIVMYAQALTKNA